MTGLQNAIIDLLRNSGLTEILGINQNAIRSMLDQSGEEPKIAAIVVDVTHWGPYPGTIQGDGVYSATIVVHLMTHLDEDEDGSLMDDATVRVWDALSGIAGDFGGKWVDYVGMEQGGLAMAEPYRTRTFTVTMYAQEAT